MGKGKGALYDEGKEKRGRNREREQLGERWRVTEGGEAECRGRRRKQAPREPRPAVGWGVLGDGGRGCGVLLAPHTPGSHTPAPGLGFCQEEETTAPPPSSLSESLFFSHSHSALSLFPKVGE